MKVRVTNVSSLPKPDIQQSTDIILSNTTYAYLKFSVFDHSIPIVLLSCKRTYFFWWILQNDRIRVVGGKGSQPLLKPTVDCKLAYNHWTTLLMNTFYFPPNVLFVSIDIHKLCAIQCDIKLIIVCCIYEYEWN